MTKAELIKMIYVTMIKNDLKHLNLIQRDLYGLDIFYDLTHRFLIKNKVIIGGSLAIVYTNHVNASKKPISILSLRCDCFDDNNNKEVNQKIKFYYTRKIDKSKFPKLQIFPIHFAIYKNYNCEFSKDLSFNPENNVYTFESGNEIALS